MSQPEIISTAKLGPDVKFFLTSNYKKINCSNMYEQVIYVQIYNMLVFWDILTL
jgi:hypothetical protein